MSVDPSALTRSGTFPPSPPAHHVGPQDLAGLRTGGGMRVNGRHPGAVLRLRCLGGPERRLAELGRRTIRGAILYSPKSHSLSYRCSRGDHLGFGHLTGLLRTKDAGTPSLATGVPGLYRGVREIVRILLHLWGCDGPAAATEGSRDAGWPACLPGRMIAMEPSALAMFWAAVIAVTIVGSDDRRFSSGHGGRRDDPRHPSNISMQCFTATITSSEAGSSVHAQDLATL